MERKPGQQTGRYLAPLADHMCRVPTHRPAQVELGVSGNPTGQARRCLPETQAKGDLTAESASQTRRVGGPGVHPPRRGGTWDAFNKQGACLGAKERSGESGSGHRLALLREPRSSHLALLSTSLIRRQKDKPWEGEGLSLELALLLGGS